MLIGWAIVASGEPAIYEFYMWLTLGHFWQCGSPLEHPMSWYQFIQVSMPSVGMHDLPAKGKIQVESAYYFYWSNGQ